MGWFVEFKNCMNNFMCFIDYINYVKVFDKLLEILVFLCGMCFSVVKEMVYMYCDEVCIVREVYEYD